MCRFYLGNLFLFILLSFTFCSVKQIQKPLPTIETPGIMQELFLTIPENWKDAEIIPVLCYHWLSPPKTFVSTVGVLEDEFEKQMNWLKENNYTSIDSFTLYEYILKGEFPKLNGKKPVVISFDDGSSNIYTKALPIVEKYGFKTVQFIVPGILGKTEGMWASWDRIHSVHKTEDIQSHSNNHPKMMDLTADKRRQEFSKSRNSLEKELNTMVRFLAYPYGNYTDDSPILLKESGYLGAFTVFEGGNIPGMNPFLMNRYMVRGGESIEVFSSKIKVRPLPVVELSSIPGGKIKPKSKLTFRLPKNLEADKIKVSIQKSPLSLQYDPTTGKSEIEFPANISGENILTIKYITTESEYASRIYYKVY